MTEARASDDSNFGASKMEFYYLQEQPLSLFEEGWYRFASSNKIKKGMVYTRNYFGTSFVCYRDKKNKVHIFNAYCPHLGAHLGCGGTIKKDQLICPFHGWKYNTEGRCVEIPYCKKIPKRASLQSYASKELHSTIFIYLEKNQNVQPFLDILEPSFQPVFSLALEAVTLSKLVNNDYFTFKPYGPGVFLSNHIILMATPISEQSYSVAFAWRTGKIRNPLRLIRQKKRITNELTLILSKVMAL